MSDGTFPKKLGLSHMVLTGHTGGVESDIIRHHFVVQIPPVRGSILPGTNNHGSGWHGPLDDHCCHFHDDKCSQSTILYILGGSTDPSPKISGLWGVFLQDVPTHRFCQRVYVIWLSLFKIDNPY